MVIWIYIVCDITIRSFEACYWSLCPINIDIKPTVKMVYGSLYGSNHLRNITNWSFLMRYKQHQAKHISMWQLPQLNIISISTQYIRAASLTIYNLFHSLDRFMSITKDHCQKYLHTHIYMELSTIETAIVVNQTDEYVLHIWKTFHL